MAATPVVLEVVASLNEQLPELFDGSITVINLVGFTVAGTGLWTIKTASSPRNAGRATTGAGVSAVILGSMLMSLGAVLEFVSQSTFGVGSRQDLLAYTAPSGLGDLKELITFVVYAAGLVGLYGVVSGGFDIKRSTSGNDGHFFLGLTKLFAGVAAINLEVTAQYLGNSFGTTVSSIVNKLI